ncbi:cyclic nucleotide-binding protein [Aquimarina atlantica]|uniref:Cyclic nucleotide-binding protein n=1 Tax=Aquimarina atlantica TaxID=1317122 RepID=A0A023BU73_9FLAO|nr:Crp/Fnr family transcriptional regulator [Aquimarina atlantica]EZH73368.1 cyclic nucleotide-binding protein [Aquimarina atlantica]
MQHYYQVFYDYINNIIVLPERDKKLIEKTFQPVFLKKGTILEAAGNIPLYHNFIVSGHLRNFHLNEDQEEITTDLNNGPRFFTSYFHFMNQTVSNENLQCITDCELLRINRKDIEESANESITQKKYTTILFEKLLEEERQRSWDLVNLTAEQLYHKFASNNPNIIKNVPLRYIASYIGITPRHLSRIRK